MSRLFQFIFGVKKLFQGIGFLFRHPKLWPWAMIPVCLAILFLILGWGIFVNSFADFYHFLLSFLGLETITKGEGFWENTLYGGLWLIQQLLKPFLFLLGLILLSIASYLAYLIVAEPFLDLLAEKTTTLIRGTEPIPFQWRRFLKTIGQSVLIALQKVGLFLLIPILLWVLNLIPVFGNFLYLFLTFLFEMWFLGFTTIEYPMSHERLPFRRRFQFGREQKYALCGLGIPFLIPFGPLLLQAPMVVGGTLLYHELRKPVAYSPATIPDYKK